MSPNTAGVLAGANFWGHLANTLITTVATLGGAYFVLQGNMVEQDATKLEIVFNRVLELEEQVATLQQSVIDLSEENYELKAENTNLTVRIGVMQSRLELGPESGTDYVFNLLESLDVPAWCKIWTGDPPHFEMAYINSWYEFRYDVRREKYIGATDFDIHPVQIAKAFNENDLNVYKDKGWADFTETVRNRNGELETRRFWKFYHRVEGGPELICGWEVPTEASYDHTHSMIPDTNVRTERSL